MRVNYDEAVKYGNNNAQNNDFKVQFFNLKDGEKAIVRILVDSINDIAPFTFHDVVAPEGGHKKVSCARSLREDVSKCPMCAAGMAVDQIAYVHLLQYFQNPDGTWRAEAKTWGKKPSNSDKSVIGMIRKALDEYGPLSDYISTITRTGTELNTTYSLNINVPEKVYGPASNYPFDKQLFDGYTEDGTVVRNWSADDMNRYIRTGEVPVKQPANITQQFDPSTAKPAYNNMATSVNDNNLPFNNVSQQQYAQAPMNDNLPFSDTNTVGNPVNYGVNSQSSVMDRPVRRYN